MASLHSGPRCLLFDNGSLRPESTLNLRGIAGRLQTALGVEVQPASLLHSSAIPPGELEGVPAQLLVPALQACLAAGTAGIVLLPLFFGPSAALTDQLPPKLEALRRKHPGQRVWFGRCLVDPSAKDDFRIASILAENVRTAMTLESLERPPVVLVDHGSPQRAVVAVRDFLAGQLAVLLAGEIDQLVAASMERRPGAEYDFCDPLLSAVLRRPGLCERQVIVAQQFLSPGRHAGMGGDVEGICRDAERDHPRLKTYPTRLIGADERLIPVLCDRYREALASAPIIESDRSQGRNE